MKYTKEITILSEKYVNKRISFSLTLDDEDKFLSVYALCAEGKQFLFCIPINLHRASFSQIRTFDEFIFGDARCIFLTDIPSLLFDLFVYCSNWFAR